VPVDELVLTLDEELVVALLVEELVLTLDDVEIAELVEVAHAFTTPYGDGCAAQVLLAIQLLPFS
jgi:hypothetical protein